MVVRPWSEKVWFSPCYVISELASAVASRDTNRIKRMKEAWICAVALICWSIREPNEWWIQIPKQDPPDLLAMRLIPTEDGQGQQLSQLNVEVFEISEHDAEPIEKSITRKLSGKDYSGMVVIGFVKRAGVFDHKNVASRLKATNPLVGSLSLIVSEEISGTNRSFIQLLPEVLKFNADFGAFCKTTSQKDFVDMRRGTKTVLEDSTTTDWLTMVP